MSALRRAYGVILRVPLLGPAVRLPVRALREAIAGDAGGRRLVGERQPAAAETEMAALAARVAATEARLEALEAAQGATGARLREIADGLDLLAEAVGALRTAAERQRPGSP